MVEIVVVIAYNLTLLIALVWAGRNYTRHFRKMESLITAIYLNKKSKVFEEEAQKACKKIETTAISPMPPEVSGGLEEEIKHFKKNRGRPEDDDFFKRAKE